MIHEFEKLTGFHPTTDLYKAIEHAYMNFDGDKVEFCKAYVENRDNLASRIARTVDEADREIQLQVNSTIRELEKQNAELAKKLEAEQEWKVGDIVTFTGSKHYANANAASGPACKPGKAKITAIYQLGKSKHPYHLVNVSGGGSTVYGWVDVADIKEAATEAPHTPQTWTPKVGDVVNYSGSTHYTSANSSSPKACKGGKAKITQIYQLGKSKHPYHLVRVSGAGATVYGWVDAGTFTKA